jgi:hypothetical protein
MAFVRTDRPSLARGKIYIAWALVCTVALTFVLKNELRSPIFLGRYESDDVYSGEWNLQRDQQADFPGGQLLDP